MGNHAPTTITVNWTPFLALFPRRRGIMVREMSCALVGREVGGVEFCRGSKSQFDFGLKLRLGCLPFLAPRPGPNSNSWRPTSALVNPTYAVCMLAILKNLRNAASHCINNKPVSLGQRICCRAFTGAASIESSTPGTIQVKRRTRKKAEELPTTFDLADGTKAKPLPEFKGGIEKPIRPRKCTPI